MGPYSRAAGFDREALPVGQLASACISGGSPGRVAGHRLPYAYHGTGREALPVGRSALGWGDLVNCRRGTGIQSFPGWTVGLGVHLGRISWAGCWAPASLRLSRH